MRISDWSSDVCSSDLDIAAVGVDRGDDGDAGGEAAKRLSKLFRVEIARHRKRLRHASETVVHCMHRRGPGPTTESVCRPDGFKPEIGRAAGRERGCQYV